MALWGLLSRFERRGEDSHSNLLKASFYVWDATREILQVSLKFCLLFSKTEIISSAYHIRTFYQNKSCLCTRIMSPKVVLQVLEQCVAQTKCRKISLLSEWVNQELHQWIESNKIRNLCEVLRTVCKHALLQKQQTLRHVFWHGTKSRSISTFDSEFFALSSYCNCVLPWASLCQSKQGFSSKHWWLIRYSPEF